jgi:flagellin
MALSVLNNIASLTAQNELAVTNNNLQNTLFQLSSGSRINSGADDPAGLSIADGLQANITALTQSAQNATNGVGQLQVADGALSQVTTLLNRAVTLATEAANGGLTSDQYGSITNEYSSILSEINRIGNATNFNGNSVFGSANAPNLNQMVTSATTSLTAGAALTGGSTTTVQLGNGTAYSYTAGNAADTLQGNQGSLTTATTLTNGTSVTLTNTVSGVGTNYTFTANPLTETGATPTAASTVLGGTVDTLAITNAYGTHTLYTAAGGDTIQTGLNAINAAGAQYGVSAYLNGSGDVVIKSTTGISNFNANAGFTSDFGTMTAGAGTDTVGDMINQINASGDNMNALLVGGKLEITSTNTGTLSDSNNGLSSVIGTLTPTNTIQDLINGIDNSGLGVTAGLQNVTNMNELRGATAMASGGATALTAGTSTITINSGAQNPLTGAYANTYSFTASSTNKDPVTGQAGTATIQGLIDSINSSGTPFHAFLDSSNHLQITDSSYSGNLAVTSNITATTGTFSNLSATQLAITDPLNRGDLTATNNDTALGYVGPNASGNALEGENADSFINPAGTGSGGANVFISDGQVSSNYNTIAVAVGTLSTSQIGTNSTTLSSANLGTASGAASALTAINGAISDVAAMRGSIGAGINRLNSATNVINTQIQNLTSAQSSIQDANVGQVVASLSKYQILEQTGISALAQSNQNQQAILKLLQ